MNRKQLYNEITSLNLQGEVQTTYGKNYTTCSNAQLEAVVEKAHKGLKKTRGGVAQCGYNSLSKLVEILAKKKILLKSEVTTIMNA